MVRELLSRRTLFKLGFGAGISLVRTSRAGETGRVTDAELARICREPVLDTRSFSAPVRMQTVQLLRNGSTFLVRVRSRDGAEGLSVANSARLRYTWPIFVGLVAPFFLGKDARRLEELLFELYRWRSNYKLQGLAFWVCVAACEMAILDMLGRIAGKSIGGLFGGVKRRDIAVYPASGHRGNKPEEEVKYLKHLVEKTGARAVKFRVGGRMSRNADSLPGRTEALIPLAREVLGEKITLYADSNSSYDVANAIRIGRLLEKYNYGFFEEPCPFDHLWETKQVARALRIPVAGGEQEFSMRRFRWMIAQRAVDIVQPDLHYFGGFIRCTKVALMAHRAGMPCTVHMSGGGLGYVHVLHFASYIPDPGPFQEFKGETRLPVECPTSSLKCRRGVIRCPSGPGFGVTLDPDFVSRAKVVRRGTP